MPKKLAFHPQAETRFNELAGEVVAKVRNMPTPPGRDQLSTTLPIDHKVNWSEMRDFWIWEQDIGGIIVSKQKAIGSEWWGFDAAGYASVRRLADNLLKVREIKDTLSRSTVEATICRYCVSKAKEGEPANFVEKFVSVHEGSIRIHHILIPIYETVSTVSFEMGKVKFLPLTPAFFDHWCADATLQGLSVEPIERLRKRFQGRIASSCHVEAEASKAGEVAMELTDIALAGLRFFSPAAVHPLATSYCTPVGKENVMGWDFFALSDSNRMPNHWGGTESNLETDLGESRLKVFSDNGIGFVHRLLAKDKPSQFEESLIESFLTHSRATLASRLSDKLVYIFTALDSFLLKDETEPITQSIAERIAFLAGATSDERQRIEKVVRGSYGMRSRIIHHNETSTDVNLLQEFMEIVWTLYLRLCANEFGFLTVGEMQEHIRNLKYS